jgi:tRNA-binding EMAP/Myf-like protein
MPRPLNVTTPPIAATVTVPRRVDPAEPAVRVAVTDDPVEILKLLASWNLTTGWVVKAIPLTAPAALVVLTIFVAAAAPRVIVCVATVNPVAVKVIV